MNTTEAIDFAQIALAGGVFSVALLTGGVLIKTVLSSNDKAAGKKAPSPPIHPIFLNTFDLLSNMPRLLDWILEACAKYGGKTGLATWRLRLRLAPDFVIVNEPENLKRILQNVDIYGKGPVFRNLFENLLGDGFFSNDGAYCWSNQRKGFGGAFKANNLRGTLANIVKKNVANLVEAVDKRSSSNESHVANMWETYNRFTFDVACDMAYGRNRGAQKGGESALHFLEAFERCQHHIHDLFVSPIHHALYTALTPSGWQFNKDAAYARQFSMDLVKDTLKQLKEGGKNSDNPIEDSAVVMLAERGRAQGTPFDEVYLRDATLSFIFGAWDTTALTLNWMTWLLTQHPHIQDNIREEAKRVLGDLAYDPQNITYDHVVNLVYTHAFMMETLRLYPPSAKNVKYCLQDDTLPDGTAISKGDLVVFWPYVMGRSPTLWDEPNEIRPERFLETDSEGNQVLTKPSSFTYTVFQAGPRICLGSDLAYLEAKLAIVSLLLRYDLRLAPGQDVKPVQHSLTMPTEQPLQVIFEKRDDFWNRKTVAGGATVSGVAVAKEQ